MVVVVVVEEEEEEKEQRSVCERWGGYNSEYKERERG